MRQFVVDIALGVIAEGFDAEAVVIVRRDHPDQPPKVATRLPPSWDAGSGLTFELFGQLWNELDAGSRHACSGIGAPSMPAGRSVLLGGRHGWVCHQRAAGGVLAAGVVRGQPLTTPETAALARVVRSVGVAVGGHAPGGDVQRRLSVRVGPDGGEWWAEVRLDPTSGHEQRSSGRAATRELAVARAAAALSLAPCHVSFAGTTRLEGAAVTVVVVDDVNGSPLLGLSVGDGHSDGDSAAGPAEAVLAALGVLQPDDVT